MRVAVPQPKDCPGTSGRGWHAVQKLTLPFVERAGPDDVARKTPLRTRPMCEDCLRAVGLPPVIKTGRAAEPAPGTTGG